MNRPLVPFLSGLLFAVGLVLGGMTDPDKVLAFLDVAGAWDPALAFVMIGAIAVYSIAYRLSRSMSRPMTATAFARLPPPRLDARLVIGAVIFGVGWGLAGFCPGPALVSVATGAWQVLAFALAMAAGFFLTRTIDARVQRGAARARADG